MHDRAQLDAIVALVAGLEAPLPLSTLGTRARGFGIRLGNPSLGGALRELAAAGRVFEHPVGRRGSNPSPRYWHRPAADYVREAVQSALGRQPEWTLAQLRKMVPAAYQDLVEEQLGGLLADGELHTAPARGRTRRFRTDAPRPTESLTAAQLQALRKLVARVNELRRPALAFEAVLALLDGKGPAPAASGPAVEPPAEGLLLRWYAEDLPRRPQHPRDGVRDAAGRPASGERRPATHDARPLPRRARRRRQVEPLLSRASRDRGPGHLRVRQQPADAGQPGAS